MQKIEHDSAKNIDEQAKSIINAIQLAGKASIPTRNNRRWAIGRQPWWTNELTVLKNNLSRLRRAGAHRDERSIYKSSRNNYLHEIRKAKRAAWKTFSGDINIKQWGSKESKSKDRIICSLLKPDGSQTNSVEETANLLLDTFVPIDINQGLQDWHGSFSKPPMITETDIKMPYGE